MRLSDYLINRLYDVGVNYIFQVTGRGSLFLNDAVAKHQLIKGISLHHEQSCAFAALSYAEQTGNIGACLVSTGCASTNTLTGLLCAWQDGIPCIFISGQNILKETTHFTGIPLRTYGQQEADIVSIVKPITKFAVMIKSAEEIEEVIEKALSIAMSGRKGPVWIDIPLDLQSSFVSPKELVEKNKIKISIHQKASEKDIEYIYKNLSQAKRPVLLIGSGVKSAGAKDVFEKFVEEWKIPVTFSSSASDCYGSGNPLSIGSVGSMGCSRAGNFTIQNSDLLIILGCRLTSLTTGIDFCSFAREAKIIVVDIDPYEHKKESIKIDKFIESDLLFLLNKLIKFKPINYLENWINKTYHWKTLFSEIEEDFKSDTAVDLYHLSLELSKILPSPSTVITDSGLAEVILPTNINFKKGIKCIHPSSQGSMGFALPAAIGSYFGNQNPTITIVGDGSIMMNLQELETIKYHNLPIKIIVINNNVYSIIRRRQKDLFRKRTIGTDPSNGVSCPNFSNVAECFGLAYMKVEHSKDLTSSLKNCLRNKNATILEIVGKIDQGYIEVAVGRNSITKRPIRRPLEDQSPFLSRELLRQEMIISPIEE